jgi:hypothetical protein
MDKLHKDSKKIKKLKSHLQRSEKTLIVNSNSLKLQNSIVPKKDWKKYLKEWYVSFDQYKKTDNYQNK